MTETGRPAQKVDLNAAGLSGAAGGPGGRTRRRRRRHGLRTKGAPICVPGWRQGWGADCMHQCRHWRPPSSTRKQRMSDATQPPHWCACYPQGPDRQHRQSSQPQSWCALGNGCQCRDEGKPSKLAARGGWGARGSFDLPRSRTTNCKKKELRNNTHSHTHTHAHTHTHTHTLPPRDGPPSTVLPHNQAFTGEGNAGRQGVRG